MRNPFQVFKFSLFINILVILYSAYQVKVNDSEWWGYTFIGVFLWTVGMFLATPSKKMPTWYNLNDLLLYPFMFLIVIKVFALSSGLKSFVIYTITIFIAIEIAIHFITRQQPNKVARLITIYYILLICLAWILYYKYPLLSLTYSLFVLYCLLRSEETTRKISES
ncbi:hypothetical protein E3E26_02430 [Thermococcus sp. LS1]|uniref:hypothetical protein n=1 Tax=Thermococcus sp. LS1 TaxID=1638259 RepID=UPI00143C5384|nr:hypothetical protein [Thermococcus sp. LS1]NJD98655.1 hypothetical protein [Thermococcus sp. LS1]